MQDDGRGGSEDGTEGGRPWVRNAALPLGTLYMGRLHRVS